MNLISIKTITFYNPENHFTIIKDEKDIYYQGCIFYPYKNQKIEVKTEPIKTAYGEQKKIVFVKYVQPNKQDELIGLLSSGLIPKIGEKTAQKIIYSIIDYEEFWKNPEKDINQVTINDKLKKSLLNNIVFYKNFIALHEQFSLKGFTQDSIIKINEIFKEKALFILQNNPYQFYKKIPLLTFQFLDKVAESFDLSKHSKERILAGTYACIDEHCEENKCSGIEFNKLHKIGFQFLNIDDGIYYSTLNHLIDDKELCEITINDKLFIATPQIYYTELGIANTLKKIKNGNIIKNPFLSELPNFLSEHQKKSIEILLNNKVAILTGMPGSGKTTIIQYAIELYKKQNPDKIVYIGTPTGKASQRVKETNPNLNVSTNHRLLGFLPNGSFIFNEKNLLEVDLLVLDETSMVDMFMFYSLLKALPNRTQLWLIGDSNQLPSIQLGDVLLDLITSNYFAYHHLHEVFRQNENSKILKNAKKQLKKKLLNLL